MRPEVEAKTEPDTLVTNGGSDPVDDTGLRLDGIGDGVTEASEPTDQEARALQAREAKKEQVVLKLADDLELRQDANNWVLAEGNHRSYYPIGGWWGVLEALLAIARKRHLAEQKVADLRELLRIDREAQAQAMLWGRELRLTLGGPEQPSEIHFWEAVAILAVTERLYAVIAELRRGRDVDAILDRMHSQGAIEVGALSGAPEGALGADLLGDAAGGGA